VFGKKRKCGMHLSITFRTLKRETSMLTYAVGAASAAGAASAGALGAAFFAYFRLNLSIRPAESTSFCFPV
jgi:hypothetical protein